MAQGRSLLGQVIKNFVNSFKPRKSWGIFKGRDESGVEYYEDSSTLRGKRPSRWFTPSKGFDSFQELPVEWEAWLRHKRKLPPTEEEIHQNRLKMMRVIENAKKLETPQKVEKEMEPFNRPAFPMYEEFSTGPSLSKIKNDKQ